MYNVQWAEILDISSSYVQCNWESNKVIFFSYKTFREYNRLERLAEEEAEAAPDFAAFAGNKCQTGPITSLFTVTWVSRRLINKLVNSHLIEKLNNLNIFLSCPCDLSFNHKCALPFSFFDDTYTAANIISQNIPAFCQLTLLVVFC